MRWNQLPTPLGVERAIHWPPVDNVWEAAAQITSILSMKAASSSINNDRASERPLSSPLETALICEPFLYLRDNLLSSVHFCFNQLGRLACMTRTLVTRFFAVSCFVAITKIFLSWWKDIIHSAYPAVNVDIPNCLALRMILKRCCIKSSIDFSWKLYKWKGTLPFIGCCITQYFFRK